MPDALGPGVLVTSDVRWQVWCAHSLFCKLANLLPDGAGCPFLEPDHMDLFVLVGDDGLLVCHILLLTLPGSGCHIRFP